MKLVSLPVGVHAVGSVPSAENMTMNRLGEVPARARRGSIASSQGSAIAAPAAPRRMVLRDIGFMVGSPAGRSRKPARRTVVRTIALKSPPSPVRAVGQRGDRALVAGRLLAAPEGVAEPLGGRAGRDLGARGQLRRQAGDAVEGRRRRRCRSALPVASTGWSASVSRQTAGGVVVLEGEANRIHQLVAAGAKRVGGVLGEALARRLRRIDDRRARRSPTAAAAAAACRTAAPARTGRAAWATSAAPRRAWPGTSPA